jgi:hypothetical protein
MFLTILLILLFIDFLVFAAWDRYILSGVILVATIVAAYFFIPPVAEALAVMTLWDVAYYVGLYLAAGAGTAMIKWLAHLFKVGRFIGDCKATFSSYPNPDDVNKIRDYRAFMTYVKDKGYNSVCRIDSYTSSDLNNALYTMGRESPPPISEDEMLAAITPRVANYRARIGSWVAQWPFVLLSLLFEDLLLKFGRWVADVLDLLFGRLARSIIKRALAR